MASGAADARGGQLPRQGAVQLRLVAAHREAQRDARAEAVARGAHLRARACAAPSVSPQVGVDVRLQGGAHGVQSGFVGSHVPELVYSCRMRIVERFATVPRDAAAWLARLRAMA